MAIELTVSPDLAMLLRIGVLTCDVTRVLEDDTDLAGSLSQAEEIIRAGDGLDVGPSRQLYRSIGIDPTKTRPSSEALLRRVRRGDPLPRINTLVDLCNWCSLEAQLPYGLYDLDRVEPPVTLRRGRPGEAYPGIRKDEVHLDGRLTLVDTRGPFGNPTSDSARTMVTTSARRLLVVVFGPAMITPSAILRVIDMTASRYARFAGGVETWRWVA
ncbi:MAG: phenylalanine--tRNA ligase beta subunit-related protein [Acidobacteria bacterium]|nr:phenylalanine--tRNA ligase beta subunit-related protein [Acidobacteriota bacterium]